MQAIFFILFMGFGREAWAEPSVWFPPTGGASFQEAPKPQVLRDRERTPTVLGLQWMGQAFFVEDRPAYSPKRYFMSLMGEASGDFRWKGLLGLQGDLRGRHRDGAGAVLRVFFAPPPDRGGAVRVQDT
jgi:hypothetical protein